MAHFLTDIGKRLLQQEAMRYMSFSWKYQERTRTVRASQPPRGTVTYTVTDDRGTVTCDCPKFKRASADNKFHESCCRHIVESMEQQRQTPKPFWLGGDFEGGALVNRVAAVKHRPPNAFMYEWTSFFPLNDKKWYPFPLYIVSIIGHPEAPLQLCTEIPHHFTQQEDWESIDGTQGFGVIGFVPNTRESTRVKAFWDYAVPALMAEADHECVECRKTVIAECDDKPRNWLEPILFRRDHWGRCYDCQVQHELTDPS